MIGEIDDFGLTRIVMVQQHDERFSRVGRTALSHALLGAACHERIPSSTLMTWPAVRTPLQRRISPSRSR